MGARTMRCVVCNKELTDSESTMRNKHTGDYLDTCSECLREIRGYTDDDDIDDMYLWAEYVTNIDDDDKTC
jgi:hypothetical protein